MRLARSLPFLVLALALGAVVYVVRAFTDERAGSRAVGRAADCYYDGAPRADCPTPRTGPHADTAWVWAALVDTLYTRLEGGVGPATLVVLDSVRADPRDALAGRADDGRAADARASATSASALAARLREAAPALPAAVADSLAVGALGPDASARAAADVGPPARAPLGVLWTVGAKQRRVPPADVPRLLGGGARSRDEALPPRGLLRLGTPAFAGGTWALAYVERAAPSPFVGQAPTIERSWALLTKLPDGRWRAVRVLPA